MKLLRLKANDFSRNTNQFRLCNSIKKNAVPESETIDLIKETLKEGDIFVDIGANIGIFSLLASKLVIVLQIQIQFDTFLIFSCFRPIICGSSFIQMFVFDSRVIRVSQSRDNVVKEKMVHLL